ncbi:MAG: DNA polymerase domain-containing protein [Thermoplasmata archaeon]
MPTWDIRIIGSSYRREGDEVVVQVYGRTRDGKSVSVRYYGFEPYFYVVEPNEQAIEMLENDKENVKRVEKEPVKLFLGGRDVACRKVVTKFPFVVPQVREKLVMAGFKVLAADIPFHLRFTYDLDLSSCVRVHGEPQPDKKEEYTTDEVVMAERFENIDPFYPPLKILSFDIENSLLDGHLITLCGVVRSSENQALRAFHLDGDEKSIIEGFGKIIDEEDPDIITGYNIDGYDIPQILERAKKLGMPELNWGRTQGSMRQFNNRFWNIDGRIVADAWWHVKKNIKPKQETLNAVSQLLLGEKKLDVDPSRIDEEWKKDPEKVKQYCAKDAELALRILEKIRVVKKALDLATVTKLPLNDIMSGTTSLLIDSILIRRADRAKVGVPMTQRREYEDQIEGGYVHVIEPGLYHNVVVLDFKSMYPSLIIAKNICFTTISDKGSIVSPTGVRFLSRDQKPGLLPSILSELMLERDRLKRLMREAESEDEKEYYRGLQDAVKILMNAFYGVFASSFYRFTDQRIGASITAFARETIQGVIRQLEQEGYRVIYSDTDSVFVQSPHEDIEKTVEFGKELAKKFSEGGVSLEFEKVMEPFFSHGKKKRYVGRMIWPEQGLVIRGYETRRTDSFDLQSETLMGIFERILAGDTEGAVQFARENIQRVLRGEVETEKLVISRSAKSDDFYKAPDRMANVQAARKLAKMGYEFQPGMKVSWVVTNSRKTPQEVEPFVAGRKFEAKPDYRYYAERLAQSIVRVTDVFGWDERRLLTGAQQSTLFEEAKPRESSRKAKIKKTSNDVSLEDFM